MIWGFVIGVWLMLVCVFMSIFQAGKRADKASEEYWKKKDEEKKL
ncbi:hypothetical protein [Bacillus sp. FJAT-47783]|nr:hypothetical protein [Bacillus sp. FJAT-47783]